MNDLIICGADLSMNSPAIWKMYLDKDLNFVKQSFICYTTVKKLSHPYMSFYKKEQFNSYIDKNTWFAEDIKKYVSDCEYFAMEGPAFGAKGLLYNIGEYTGLVKKYVYDSGLKIRTYDPNSIKLFSTKSGKATKGDMYRMFLNYAGRHANSEILGLPVLTEKDEKKGRSPISDVIDAYWICDMLKMELMLRRGLIRLKDLTENIVSIFNRVTKAYPVNILDTEFLYKGKNG